MITASVVLYNTPRKEFGTLLNSYKPNSLRRLFIIDNSEKETDYCYEYVNAWISYIFNNKNLGYGTAHNIALRKAIALGSEYHIILNPDISFESFIIDELKRYADNHEDVVNMLPKVIYPNGEIQHLCKLFPTPADLIFRRFLPECKITRKWNDKYTLKAYGYNEIIAPPCLSGCFMFLKIDALKNNNIFFDETFFMYCEDFDLMRRLHRIGKNIFYPKVTITHEHEKASYRHLKMFLLHVRSAWHYFNKYGWLIDTERKIKNRKFLKELEKMKND